MQALAVNCTKQYITDKQGEDIWSDNGNRLIYFCTENNWIVANTIFLCKKIYMYTSRTFKECELSNWIYYNEEKK